MSSLFKFNVVAEYVADHTTSGMFLTIDLPVKEIFFTLAQLKAADSPRFDDNIKYTAKVLVSSCIFLGLS